MVWFSGQISHTRHRYILHSLPLQYDPKLDRFCGLNVPGERERARLICLQIPSSFSVSRSSTSNLSLSLSLSRTRTHIFSHFVFHLRAKVILPRCSQTSLRLGRIALISGERLGILGGAHFRNSWALWCSGQAMGSRQASRNRFPCRDNVLMDDSFARGESFFYPGMLISFHPPLRFNQLANLFREAAFRGKLL